jgi:hypothetical protein
VSTVPKQHSASLHCLVSFVAVAGVAVGYNRWLASGGWERHQHWGEGAIWALSATIGLWAAVDTIRFARGWTGVGVGLLGMLLGFFHVGAILGLGEFVFTLAEGGPRP